MLNRLRRTSVNEIAVRTRQGAYMFLERFGLWSGGRLPGSVRFITTDGYIRDRDLKADELERILKPGHHFYPSIQELETCIATIRARFPDEEARIINEADRVCDGRFDLLGYKGLSFGTTIPNWHLDPVSGKTSPLVHWARINEVDATGTGDKKIIWELNRHQFFVVLGQAYSLTLDERYAECFAKLIGSWMDSNPPKLGVNWLSSLEIAFRSMSWIWAFHLFRNSPCFTPELLTRMSKFLVAFARHIETYLSTYFSPNTHLTGEALGLYVLGSFLPEVADAERWKNLGYKVLVDALEFQVRPDGTYCEQASHYLRYTLDFYSSLLVLLQQDGSGSQPEITSKLSQLYDCLLHVTMPNGHSPNFGDDDGGRLHFLDGRDVTDFRPSVALGAVLLNRADLKMGAGEASPELVWLLGKDGIDKFDAISPDDDRETTRAFPDGGIFAARSNWSSKADSILIDCGPHGFLNGGHAHADALSFIMAVDGMPIFIDSGTYTYTADLTERDRFRSSHAHNCLTVNDRSSSIPAGPFSWKTMTGASLKEWSATGDGIVFQGTHDGFADQGVEYARSINFDFKKGLKVEDVISSSAINLYELHFILAPGLEADITDPGAKVAIKTNAGVVLLEVDSTVSGDVVDGPTWRQEAWTVSEIYGDRTGSTKLVYSLQGSGSLRICSKFTKKPDI